MRLMTLAMRILVVALCFAVPGAVMAQEPVAPAPVADGASSKKVRTYARRAHGDLGDDP